MFQNYLNVARRDLRANKLFSFINLGGLSVGLACFMLMLLYVHYESGYERFFTHAERIYRVSQNITPKDGTPALMLATNAPQVGPLLEADFPEVEATVRLFQWRGSVQQEAGGIDIPAVALLADATIFRLFDFVWLRGSAAQGLNDPGSVVLSASAAHRYFGDADPLGRTLLLEHAFPLRVAGVIEDPPANTHLRFDMLAPIDLVTSVFSASALESWSAQYFHTYALLQEGYTGADLQAQFPGFIERHMGAGVSATFSFTTLPLTDIHLNSNRQFELSVPGNAAAVKAFIGIALLVLLIACVNFMNLATVKAAQRSREIGVRKVLGATKAQLILQFLGESILLTAFAVLIALALVELALPVFNTLLQRELSLALFADVAVVPLLIMLTLFVGIASAGYPAFYLASFKAAAVLKGNVSHGRGAALFRKALVVLQFSVAVLLIIATVTIQAQLNFLRSSDHGYARDGIVILNNTGREGLGRQWDQLKRQLLTHPGIVAVTASNTLPTDQVAAGYFIDYEGGVERRSIPLLLVDYDYFETYAIDLVTGRAFAETYGQDRRLAVTPDIPQSSGTYILNALAAAQLGWSPETALGKWIEVSCCGFGRGIVVGVVEDVRYGSLRQESGPVIYAIPPEPGATLNSETRLGLRQAAIRISASNIETSLAHIATSWRNIRPDLPLSQHFLDADFAMLYEDEQRQARMLLMFAGLAIVIACMGLFGLSTYNAQRRTKEIGVRKVMGGSVWNIVVLLTNDFSKLVLLSNLIAWPLAWLAMNRWLETFAYRIDLTPLFFIGSGMIALCIAWVTVGGTAAKAASAKPVLALRYE